MANDSPEDKTNKNESTIEPKLQTNQKEFNEQLITIQSFRDFTIHLIFLLTVVTSAFGSYEHSNDYSVSILADLIRNSKFETAPGLTKTFKNITAASEIWHFVEEILLKLLYQTSVKPWINSTTHEVIMEYALIGAPQIRQLRVKNGTCTWPSMFASIYRTCYGYYDEDIEDKDAFGIRSSYPWTYINPDEDDIAYSGYSSSYPGGGFVLNLTQDYFFNKIWLLSLKKNGWFRLETRAIFIDFTLYNGNSNRFCVVKLIFELAPTGGVISSAKFRSMKLLNYLDKWDYFVFSCQVINVFFVAYYGMENYFRILNRGKYYYHDFWNLIDISVVLTSCVLFIIFGYRFVALFRILPKKLEFLNSNLHVSFDRIVEIQTYFDATIALLLILVWLKLFKFSSINKGLLLFLTTFRSVKYELLSLIGITVLYVTAFAIMATVVFGNQTFQLKSFSFSFYTLITLFFGGLYFYDECQDNSPLFAPIFFALFLFVFQAFCLGTFIALVLRGFSVVVEENFHANLSVFLEEVVDHYVGKLLTAANFAGTVRRVRARKEYVRRKKAYRALVDIVRRRGYDGLETALLIGKFRISPDERVNFDTMVRVYDEFRLRNQLSLEVENHMIVLFQIDNINNTLAVMNQTLNDLLKKIDLLANKILTSSR